jgi:hypothetical protein
LREADQKPAFLRSDGCALQLAPRRQGYDNSRRDPDDLADDSRGDINAGEVSRDRVAAASSGSPTLPNLHSLKKFEKVE